MTKPRKLSKYYKEGDLPAIIEDLKTMTTMEVSIKWNIPWRRVSNFRKAYVPETLRAPKYKSYCVVCGALLVNAYKKSSVKLLKSTCGSSECREVLAVRPDLSRRSYMNLPMTLTTTRPKFPFQLIDTWIEEALEVDIEAHIRACESTDCGKRLFETFQDRRGIARPVAQSDVWGDLSRLSVAFRFVDTRGGRTALRVTRRPGEPVLKALGRLYVGGADGSTYLEAFDLVVAWRCSCSLATSVSWAPAEMPDEDGYHGTCPGCGGVTMYLETKDK